MSDLMEWLLILVVGYNFLAVWIITTTLERILSTLSEMAVELEKARRNNGS